MRPEIKSLVELQAVDQRVAELRARVKDFPHQLAAVDQRVAAAKQQLASAKDALTASLKDRKTYEMDVDSWKEKARKYREQSFAVKTNEAYKALQQEVQHAESEIARAEDRLLEKMMAGEEFERKIKAAEQTFAAEERAAQADREAIRAEQTMLESQLAAKEAERARAVASIPEPLLQRYESIARRRHGIALAEVRDECCRQCGVRVRPHVFQELRREDCSEVFECETCTRILYYVEPTQQPESAPTDARSGAASANGG